MASASRPLGTTPEEYLALERAAEFRHEYLDGQIYAMAGGTASHATIVGNLHGEIRQALKGRPCRVYMSDMRVWVSADQYAYPDVAGLCGEAQFDGPSRDVLLNPSVIIEVLSTTTEHWDRGGKFARYRGMESLREYVLVAQDRVRVERFVRREDEWFPEVYNEVGDDLPVDSMGVRVPLDEVYRNVGFPGPGGG